MYLVIRPGLPTRDTYRRDLALQACIFAHVNDYPYTVSRDDVDVTAEFEREVRAICANRKGAS